MRRGETERRVGQAVWWGDKIIRGAGERGVGGGDGGEEPRALQLGGGRRR